MSRNKKFDREKKVTLKQIICVPNHICQCVNHTVKVGKETHTFCCIKGFEIAVEQFNQAQAASNNNDENKPVQEVLN